MAAIDIDGTIADHHGHFQRFAEGYVGHWLGPDRTHGVLLPSYPYDVEFSEWLGMDKAVYREAKLAFRQGGQKRTMPMREGARLLIDGLRDNGIEVWLCTTRPYLRLDNIDPDTREWCRRNGIEYDGLIYGEDKYERIANIVGSERVIAVLDDLPEMFDAAEALGLPALQMDNGQRGDAVRRPRTASFTSALRIIRYRAEGWRAETERREHVTTGDR